MNELEVAAMKFRRAIPAAHKKSLDTRVVWLWHQRFGTVQTILLQSKDLLDVTAATLIVQAIFGKDLTAIEQLITRLEGGALTDAILADREIDSLSL